MVSAGETPSVAFEVTRLRRTLRKVRPYPRGRSVRRCDGRARGKGTCCSREDVPYMCVYTLLTFPPGVCAPRPIARLYKDSHQLGRAPTSAQPVADRRIPGPEGTSITGPSRAASPCRPPGRPGRLVAGGGGAPPGRLLCVYSASSLGREPRGSVSAVRGVAMCRVWPLAVPVMR